MPSSPNSPSSDDNTSEVGRLKRQVVALQDELEEARGSRTKRSETPVTRGRGIRRLITLFESLDGLIAEADTRILAEKDGVVRFRDQSELKRNADRTFESYELLLSLVPPFKTLIQTDADEDTFRQYTASLQKGANDARSDDVRRIKEEIAVWLNHNNPTATPLSPKSRDNRGLQNDVTGRLLCPIEHKWDDEKNRADMQNAVIDISQDFFITCLYKKGTADPSDVENGFLRSVLLLKTFCAVFTSPTSSEDLEEPEDDVPARKKRKTSSQKKATKTNVAGLLRMEGKVTPRAIAYAAVLLVFNLTDATQWTETYNGFNFRAFYNFIVDFFEDTPGAAAQRRANMLLTWWNSQVFQDQHAPTSSGLKASQDKLLAQRLQREQDN
ncbi:hypothetical protein CPB83DRAFT_782959 [Crepidotus variabilis]|uniref:Uncharacterized protein n=1 Tax=Crepidotus variabilis TaxID=179855 RepID=A0A9P6EP81_9AGAR|nr:hypothetical protein CPB83DRAFT_782959 [Crepidotus variabilis]